MNPQNGEIYAMVNVPEFNLNDPFTLTPNVLEEFEKKKKKEEEKRKEEDKEVEQLQHQLLLKYFPVVFHIWV